MTDSETARFSAWPTLKEAATLVRLSIRTLERKAAEGKLETRQRPRPRGKPQVIVNPQDLQRLMPAPHVMPALKRPAAPPPPPRIPPQFALAPALKRGKNPDILTLLAAIATMTATTPQSSTPTRFMTIGEASAYSGLSKAFLDRAITESKLKAVRDGRILKVRREDVDKL